jgi:glycosyltransferase involved in cell wall biosynthesis
MATEQGVSAQPRTTTQDPVSFAPPPGPTRSLAGRPASVLHVFNYFAPDFTGEGIYATKLFVHLQSLGVVNDVLVKRTHPRVPGVRSTEILTPVRHTIHYLPPRWSHVVPELQIAWWLLRHGRRYGAVHYHSHCDRRFLSALVSRALGMRVIMSCTLDDSPRALVMSYRPAFRWLVRRLLRLVDTFVSISPKLHGDASGLVPTNRHMLIPQGVDVPKVPRLGRSRLRQELGLTDTDLVLLFVGAQCERKNQRFLIEQMPATLQRQPRARLFLVGPTTEDDYAVRIRQRAQELGLQDAVRFVGFTDRTEDWYALADVLVFASTNEGFGNVLLEAMAHGMPVVARRLPGVTDSFIEHGETGLLFDDAPGYLHAVNALAADPALRQRIGANARAVAAERFSLPQVAQHYAALYMGR